MNQVRRAWWGTAMYFLLHGLIVATWLSRVPQVQTNLHLSNGVLGIALLCATLGSLSGIPFAGRFITARGSAAATWISTILLCVAVTLPGFAFNPWSLGAALYCFGGTAGAMDVSMNAQGVEVENRMQYPTMSRFHGMFSLGAMIGAGIGGLVAAHHVPVQIHFVASAAVYAVWAFGISPLLLHTKPQPHEHAHRLSWRSMPRVLVFLSAIGFFCLLSEGAMGDWTAVYLSQVLHAGPGIAAAGYSVFSAAMATFRFLGDWTTAKVGAFGAVRGGSVIAACGMLWALSAQTAAWAMPGLAIVGVGFSVIIPLVFGSGGRIQGVNPGAGIATVTGLGYTGFIVGPPAIGFLSQAVTLRYALGVIVFCCVASAILAQALRTIAAYRAPSQTSLP